MPENVAPEADLGANSSVAPRTVLSSSRIATDQTEWHRSPLWIQLPVNWRIMSNKAVEDSARGTSEGARLGGIFWSSRLVFLSPAG
jgi:hypothetical protein